MEPVTVLATAIISKKSLERLLGPTVDYLGEELKTITAHRVNNIKGILEKSLRKRDEDQKGSVSPRILQKILAEGSYCEDELIQEYISGVLAGSQTDNDLDDKGVYILSNILRMSSYQLRTHYMIYHLIRKLYLGESLKQGGSFNLNLISERGIKIPTFEYFDSVGIPVNDYSFSELTHVFQSLQALGLIELYSSRVEDEKDIIQIRPSISGIEMYLWIFNKANYVVGFYDERLDLENEIEIPTPEKYTKINY